MRDYQMEVNSYTRGQGKLTCNFRGYEPCHNAEEIIEEKNYDPERDLENPTGSVFCAHGAGFVVPWEQVTEYMHIESRKKRNRNSDEEPGTTEERQKNGERAAEETRRPVRAELIGIVSVRKKRKS